MIRDLGDQDPNVRALAFQALQEKKEAALPALIKALKDKDWKARNGAVNLIRAMGADGKDAPPALIKTLKDPNLNVRLDTMRAIENTALLGSREVPALLSALKDNDDPIRRWIVKQIGAMGTEGREVSPFLIALL